MKEQESIPTGKFERAGSFIGTTAKVSGNYIKHYSKRLVGAESTKRQLQEDNAEDIYSTLSKLKGSALKVAQMMSLDQGILPEAYSKKFSQAQYSAPPLSYPLVVKTFRSSLKHSPKELFDSFESSAFAAASIGQVHLATKDGNKLAVKIQYPGIANSISSDLKIVKPLVATLFNINYKEMEHYLVEVEERLIEETDYNLELKRSKEITEACAHIKGLVFPKYYPEYSADKILTMDWMDGKHLNEFMQTNPSQELRNKLGQLMWDFYDFQIHKMLQVHADPHPGNFLFQENGDLGILDFGCVKQFEREFYTNYFQLMKPAIEQDKEEFTNLLFDLDFLLNADSQEEVDHFTVIYADVLKLLGKPFMSDEFDFADDAYFKEIYGFSELYSNDKLLKKAKAARGPRDAIYLNRTYFGLYSLLNQLGAKIKTNSYVNT